MRQVSQAAQWLRRLARQLDRVCAELNAVLLAVAIGFAVLDGTCVVMLCLAHAVKPQAGGSLASALALPAGMLSARGTASRMRSDGTPE